MKWIGQHIVDLIARFRSDVYLEDIDTGTIASGGNLGLDSNNKIVKATETTGDLTGITAGTGLSGTDLTGPVPTLNVDAAQTGITSLGTLSSLAVTSASDLGSSAMILRNNDVDKHALEIIGNNTTANVVDITALTATTGSAIKVQGNDQSDESVVLVKVSDNETVSTPGTPRALIEADASKTGVVASTESRLIYGIRSTLTDTATNHANSAVVLTAFKGTVDSASTSGLNYNTGLDLSVTDATYNTGISLLVEDGGDDIVMKSSADPGDLCTIATTTHGATKITTIDDDLHAAAHFEIEADGDITLDAAGQIKLEPGTSVLWDSLALTGIQASSESFGDNDVSLMTSAAINDRIESFGYTTNTGDITGVSFITDSGGAGRASDTDGTADFSILGTSGVGVTNSTTTITVTSVPGEIDHDSLLNFAADEHFTQANITTVGTIGTGVWNGDAIAHAYIAADAIETDNIADAQVTVAKLHADAVQTSGETFADDDTSLMTSAAIDDRITVKSKHVLRCAAFYANGNFVQNSLFIGNSVGNSPFNWNDQAAVGGAISTTSSFTIVNDDEQWGIVLPVDISKIEVQCSLRPSGNPGAIDFSVAVYTGVRSSNSSSDLTLTKIGHQSVSFNSGNQRYKQNDLTGDDAIVGNYDKGTMIYVGVGTEDAPNNAKNGRGYMNITVTER